VSVGGSRLADAVMKVRSQDIVVEPGYDGEFGKVAIWGEEGEEEKREEQMSLF
jgi:PHP family Zn ribbon phosphoesterase